MKCPIHEMSCVWNVLSMILKCPNAPVHSLNKFSQFGPAVLPALENTFICPEAEFKEFEPRIISSWFHLKLYSVFKIKAGAQLKPGFGRFDTQLKFINFGHWRSIKHNVECWYNKTSNRVLKTSFLYSPNQKDFLI